MIKLYNILRESILTPRRSASEREQNHLISVQKRIQEYIKNGSKGDLDLSNLPFSNFRLPNNLTKVNGELDLRGTDIYELPPTLYVDSLALDGCPIFKLPNNLTVKYLLSVSRCHNLLELPKFKTIGNTLKLHMDGSRIKVINDNIIVGDLSATYSRLEEIGKNFRAYGAVDLSYAHGLKHISSNFKASKWVNLSYSSISDIPRDMSVGETLDIEKTPFQKKYFHMITDIAKTDISKEEKWKKIRELYPNVNEIDWGGSKIYQLKGVETD